MRWKNLFEDRPTRPLVLGIVNVSPESFYSGSVASDVEDVVARVRRLESEGADAIDIGARSTAPYKETAISIDVEVTRMAAAIRAARAVTNLPISADTPYAVVAEAALEEGADAINDVSGLLADPGMAGVIATAECGAILMVRENESKFVDGESPADTVARLLGDAMNRAQAGGIATDQIALDPGIGFFRERHVGWHSWDLAVLRSSRALRHEFGRPLVIGASRKSFLGALLGETSPDYRLAGSLAVASWCAIEGVEMLRVHDVRETRDALRVIEALEEGPK